MDLVTMANEMLTKAKEAMTDTTISGIRRFINSTDYMLKYHVFMRTLELRDPDTFIKVSEGHRTTIDDISTMWEATS
jgi:hypothetical protein